MANNFLSYNRFTTLPPVIMRYGWTEEEAAATRGKPDPNPLHSPMAASAATEVKLALVPAGSDKMRLAGPGEPKQNPYEGPKMTLGLSRNAVKKLSGNVIGQLQHLVQGNAINDPNLRALMGDSIRRVVGLREYMDHLNRLTEGVYVRSIAASKG
ncbi:MAG: hypothetical protein A2289_22770 [Deltaproteobacteria bacterium RIFOXYA12_FULL_58_15]|nr:MAG: hypothetical protein A2289_22770 [Deltaproteobacteria bacterium RIFOXYA12_FULL_58_15]